MQKRNTSLDDLRTFCLVAEAGSLRSAGERLGVPASTVSRRVRRLEDDLGVALLHREHRRVGLTADGEALWKRSRGALRELDGVVHRLADPQAEVTGLLRVTAALGLASKLPFARLLSDFQAAHPAVGVELIATDRVVDLVEEGVDVALRPFTPRSAARHGALRMRRLGRGRFLLVASPEEAARVAEGDGGAPLAPLRGRVLAHPILDQAAALAEDAPLWAELPALAGPVAADDFDALAHLAAAGAGLAVVPALIAAPLLERGALVRVCPELDLGSSDLCLMWPASRHLAPRVRAFIDFVGARVEGLGLEPLG